MNDQKTDNLEMLMRYEAKNGKIGEPADNIPIEDAIRDYFSSQELLICY